MYFQVALFFRKKNSQEYHYVSNNEEDIIVFSKSNKFCQYPSLSFQHKFKSLKIENNQFAAHKFLIGQ